MYNEQDIIPFVKQYFAKMIEAGIDLKVVIYNNQSTDKSVEMLSDLPYVEIREFFTNNEMNDVIMAKLRNTCWLECKDKPDVDFCVVCDLDECMYSNDWLGELSKMKEGGYNVLGNIWYALCGDSFPKYDNNMLLHQIIGKGYRQHINHREEYGHLGKFILFDPHQIDYMNYSVGSHIAYPQPELKLYVSDKIFTIHFNKGFGLKYFYNKRHKMYQRLSVTNLTHGMCLEYGYDYERIKNEYEGYQNNSINIEKI